MNRAITFCAIALGIPVVTCAAVSNYISKHSVLPGVHADNGLECEVTRRAYIGKDDTNPLTQFYSPLIELLPDSKFRVVDTYAYPQALAKDGIGTMTITDTTYTLGDLKNSPSDPAMSTLASLVINRITGEVHKEDYTGYGRDTVTGYCTATYVAPRIMPKKL